MNEAQCESVRERIPDFVSDRLAPADAAPVRAHLHECAECREEAALVGLLFASRPASRDGLASRIEESLPLPRRSAARPWWGVAAAAVAAIALGIGVISDGTPTEEEVPAYVAGAEEIVLWPADDGLVAGAPALDGLSDEALITLLEEMGADPSGGAA